MENNNTPISPLEINEIPATTPIAPQPIDVSTQPQQQPQEVILKEEDTRFDPPKYEYEVSGFFKTFYPNYVKKINTEVDWLLTAQKRNLADDSDICLAQARKIKHFKNKVSKLGFVWLGVLFVSLIMVIVSIFIKDQQAISDAMLYGGLTIGGIALCLSIYTNIGSLFLSRAPLTMLELEFEQSKQKFTSKTKSDK